MVRKFGMSNLINNMPIKLKINGKSTKFPYHQTGIRLNDA